MTRVGLSVTVSKNSFPEEGRKGFSGDHLREERPTAERPRSRCYMLVDRHQLRVDNEERVMLTTLSDVGALLLV
jgi:hypothetical protein